MLDFRYTARNAQGEDVSGTLIAANKREALSMISNQSLYPLTVHEVRSAQPDWLPQPGVKTALVAETINQLADLLENGVPMLGSLNILVEQASHPTLKKVLLDIRERISEGEAIDLAFAAHPKVFSELTVSIIRAGAEGAFLEDAFKRSAAFIERQDKMKSQVTGALTYPLMLVVMGIGALIFLLTYVVPQFDSVFNQVVSRGGQLPLPTIIVLGMSELIGSYWWQAGLAIIGAIVYLRMLGRSPRAKRILDRLRLKIPLLGPVLLDAAVARFCRVFGTLLANGVPVLRSLEISSGSAGNQVLSDAILNAAESVSAGDPLAKPLADAGIVPGPIMAMISIAEESNNLENVLVNVADTLDDRVNRKLEVLVRFIEPILLVGIGANLGIIITGIILPVLEMQTG